jgi:hypothetical protein
LQTFLCDRLAVWASNGSSVEEIWNNFKNIVYESIELLYHIKYLEKFQTLVITTRKLDD